MVGMLSDFVRLSRGCARFFTGTICDEAGEFSSLLMSSAPSFWYSYYMRAICTVYSGRDRDLDRARRDADTAISLEPNEYCGYWARAAISFAEENYALCIEDLERGLRLKPGNANLLLLLACTYVESDQLVQAEKLIGELVQRTNVYEKAEALKLRARMHKKKKMYEQSVQDYVAAFGLLRRIRRVENDYCIVLCRLNRGKDALHHIDRVLLESKHDASVYSRRAWIWAKAEQYAAALTDLDRAESLRSELRSYGLRSWIFWRTERFDDCLAQSDIALEIKETSFARATKALALLSLGDISEATTNSERALELDKESVAAWISLGLIQIRLGNFEKGLQNLDQALQVDPSTSEAFRQKSIVYQQLGDTEKAKFNEDSYKALRDSFLE